MASRKYYDDSIENFGGTLALNDISCLSPIKASLFIKKSTHIFCCNFWMDALRLYNLENTQIPKVYTLPSKKQKIIIKPGKDQEKVNYICYTCKRTISLGITESVFCQHCHSRVVCKQPSKGLVYKSI